MHHFFISNNSVTVCPRFYIGNWHIVIFKAAPPLGSYFGRPTGIGEQHTESGGEKTLGQTVHNHSWPFPGFPVSHAPVSSPFTAHYKAH